MNNKEAVEYMIGVIEEIERDRLAENLSIEPTQKKKVVVDKIIKALQEVEIDDEDY